jgi:hypothetical protein
VVLPEAAFNLRNDPATTSTLAVSSFIVSTTMRVMVRGKVTIIESPCNQTSITPKYKQYKHHRWQLERTQIRRYGLSSILAPDTIWWESIKIPKRRISFLNVGDRITILHLTCEDLARQDPIAELVRQVDPTLVVAILMDGPQLKNRWSARYATVLSDDPGSSVIALTSLRMVKRHSSEFGAMSRVVALWNESGAGHSGCTYGYHRLCHNRTKSFGTAYRGSHAVTIGSVVQLQS